MDINTVRNIVTVLAFVTYLGIVLWAYGPSRKDRFEKDAHLVFDDEDPK